MAGERIETKQIAIYDGMSVDSVQQNGSEGQQIAVPLFDADASRVLTGAEAERMNNCVFEHTAGSDANTLIIYENKGNGKQQVTEIKYKDLEQLYNTEWPTGIQNKFYGDGGLFFNSGLYEYNGEQYAEHYVGSNGGDYDKISIDLTSGEVSVQGFDEGFRGHGLIAGRGIKLDISDSDISTIAVDNGEVNLKNTKDKGLLWDSATKIKTDGTVGINADSQSKYDVEIDE